MRSFYSTVQFVSRPAQQYWGTLVLKIIMALVLVLKVTMVLSHFQHIGTTALDTAVDTGPALHTVGGRRVEHEHMGRGPQEATR